MGLSCVLVTWVFQWVFNAWTRTLCTARRCIHCAGVDWPVPSSSCLSTRGRSPWQPRTSNSMSWLHSHFPQAIYPLAAISAYWSLAVAFPCNSRTGSAPSRGMFPHYSILSNCISLPTTSIFLAWRSVALLLSPSPQTRLFPSLNTPLSLRPSTVIHRTYFWSLCLSPQSSHWFSCSPSSATDLTTMALFSSICFSLASRQQQSTPMTFWRFLTTQTLCMSASWVPMMSSRRFTNVLNPFLTLRLGSSVTQESFSSANIRILSGAVTLRLIILNALFSSLCSNPCFCAIRVLLVVKLPVG